MPKTSALYGAREQLLSHCISSIGRIVLHITGDARLSRGELRTAVELLRDLIAALERPEEP